MPRDFTHTNNWKIGLQVQFAFFPWLPNAGPSNLIWITSRLFSNAPSQVWSQHPSEDCTFPCLLQEVVTMAGSPAHRARSSGFCTALFKSWPAAVAGSSYHSAPVKMISTHSEGEEHKHNESTKLPACRKLANYPALTFSRNRTKESLWMRWSQEKKERRRMGEMNSVVNYSQVFMIILWKVVFSPAYN